VADVARRLLDRPLDSGRNRSRRALHFGSRDLERALQSVEPRRVLAHGRVSAGADVVDDPRRGRLDLRITGRRSIEDPRDRRFVGRLYDSEILRSPHFHISRFPNFK
jgi:hypothetical protein